MSQPFQPQQVPLLGQQQEMAQQMFNNMFLNMIPVVATAILRDRVADPILEAETDIATKICDQAEDIVAEAMRRVGVQVTLRRKMKQ